MDNLTHSLVGALIGQAGLKKKTGLAMPALIIGANIPDLDASCYLWLTGSEPLAFRRGITHGPPAWVLLPVLVAGILWGWDRWQASRGKRPEGRLPVSFGWLYLLAFIACLSHPFFDWLNTYGIRLLEPFSSRWFHGDMIFIIDIWLWLGMGFATWLSLRREKRGGDWRKVGRVALAGVLAYVGLNAAITWRAETAAAAEAGPGQTVIASQMPFWSLSRDMIVGSDGVYSVGGMMVGTECVLPDLAQERARNASLDAFLFWSRTPYAERAEDGSVNIRDARFSGRRMGSGFTVALPDVVCEEPPTAQ